ncbi:hypothetical protein DXD80_17750 [Bacteroides xylanisolvens]|nr:hypothetical protein DXD80_17750 [Bacteroides xylanisolvens]
MNVFKINNKYFGFSFQFSRISAYPSDFRLKAPLKSLHFAFSLCAYAKLESLLQENTASIIADQRLCFLRIEPLFPSVMSDVWEIYAMGSADICRGASEYMVWAHGTYGVGMKECMCHMCKG